MLRNCNHHHTVGKTTFVSASEWVFEALWQSLLLKPNLEVKHYGSQYKHYHLSRAIKSWNSFIHFSSTFSDEGCNSWEKVWESQPRLLSLAMDSSFVPNQLWDLISLTGPGSALRPLSRGMCLKQLEWEPTRCLNHFNWLFTVWRIRVFTLKQSMIVKLLGLDINTYYLFGIFHLSSLISEPPAVKQRHSLQRSRLSLISPPPYPRLSCLPCFFTVHICSHLFN